VYGSPQYPRETQKGGWFSGKYFSVSQVTVLVDYPASFNIVNQDYAVMDLTNQTNPAIPGVPHPTAAQQGTFQMYPQTDNILYQISVGMKKGNYFVKLEIPFGTVPIYQMGSSAIPPTITDPVYRYLGAKYPKDSPIDSPTWFLYTIMNAPQIALLLFMDGGDTEAAGLLYGKATINFRVNKCVLKQISIADVAVINIPYPSGASVTVPNGCVAVVIGGVSGDTKVSYPGQQSNVIPRGQESVVGAGWTVQTGSGSAVVTDIDAVRKWKMVQERALYVPWYQELTGF
jgi:hypothetical protein